MTVGPEMEGVSRAIAALKTISSKDKRDTIQTAIGELSSVLSLLSLSTASNKVLGRLNKIFRDNLQVLFAAFPAPMCRFCAAVLDAIYKDKIEGAANSALQHSWEGVLKSVVSSILDFHDQEPTTVSKTAIGNALYPTICDIFYPRGTPFKWTSPGLILNINLLLTESATDHSRNQSDLRADNLFGTARLASALSQSKNFFALDSLIALVGVLLPARATAAKRAEFVDAIFSPRLFPCTSQIKRLILGSASTVWDPVAAQIINALAESDISFPQPFYVTGLRTSTPLPNIVDPLYVDHQGLYAEIERDGVSDSYQVPFCSMERIKLSAPGAFTTHVSLQLTSLPLVGATEIDVPERCSMVFQLKNECVARFLEAIKARGVGKLITDADRKVSKIAEGLNLEFDPSARKPSTQQEKVAKVEQLWKSTGDAGLGEPTSPLIGQSRASSNSHSEQREASSQHDAIDGEDLSDVSDGEKTASKTKSPVPSSTKRKSPASRPRVRIILDSDDEDMAAVQQLGASTRPRKSAMKKPIIEPDEEDIDPTQSPPSNAMDEDFEPTQPEKQTRPEPVADVPARVTRGAAAKKNLTLATSVAEPRKAVSTRPAARDVPDADADAPAPARSIRRPANAKRAISVDEELSEDEIDSTTTTKLTADSKASSKAQETSTNDSRLEKRPRAKTNIGPAAKDKTSKSMDDKNGRKRTPKADDDQDDPDEDEADRRPAKRQRGADAVPEEITPPAAPPRRVSATVFGDRTVTTAPAKRRYGGKKGRPSSPVPFDAPDASMAVDYDELPAPRSPTPPPVPQKVIKAAKQDAGANTRKSRAAAMKGKAGQKPAPRKSEPVIKAPPKSTKASPPEKEKPKTRAAAAKDDIEDKESEGEESRPPRRSTRTARDDTVPKPVEPISDVTIPKPKAKPQKPKKAPWEDMHLKNDAAPSSDEPPANVHRDVEMTDPIVTSDRSATESDPFDEFHVTVKGSPPIPEDDVTMIDAVQCVSPKAKILQPDLLTFDLPDMSNPIDLTSPLSKTKAMPSLPAVESQAASVALETPNAVDVTAPIRPQALSPAAKSDVILPLAMTKFQSEVPPRSMQPESQKLSTPSPARPSKLPTPALAKQPTPPRPVHVKKVPTPLARSPPAQSAAYTPPRPPPRQSRPPSRQITSDSPFPERVHPTVAFAPSRTSSPLVQRTNHQIPTRRPAKNHAHERTPELRRPGRTHSGRGPHNERDHDHKLNKSPMHAIVELLDQIHGVVVEKVSRGFEDVKTDVRMGRDGILRSAAESLEGMCSESEHHFNNLVDLEEEYAAYQRQILSGLDNMHATGEVMTTALGQTIQQHDRRSLSKKLPTTLFTLPSILRNPALSL